MAKKQVIHFDKKRPWFLTKDDLLGCLFVFTSSAALSPTSEQRIGGCISHAICI